MRVQATDRMVVVVALLELGREYVGDFLASSWNAYAEEFAYGH